jgi:hypothetical protein
MGDFIQTYYIGAARVLRGGVPCRVAAWAVQLIPETNAEISAQEEVEELKAELAQAYDDLDDLKRELLAQAYDDLDDLKREL